MPQLGSAKVVTKFHVMLETADVKRIDTYVNAWSLPVDPWVGLPSEAKLYRHLVTNQ